MKRLLFIVFILTSSIVISCKNTESKSVDQKKKVEKTTIEFLEPKHSFGEIIQGEKVSHTFVFRNTGNKPLEITQAQPSCGCTVPEWTEEPIEPGKEGKIQVMFNSEGRMGEQHKSVTVVSNTTPAIHELTFTATVIKKK